MTRLSVNINKVALIRNARGENLPDLVQFAKDCEDYGAEGITVHPRPDERHIRYDDIPKLKEIVTTEFNIEGNPTDRFLKLVLDNTPHQCTLVPDDPSALTSDHGWDTVKNEAFLTEVIGRLHEKGVRVSIFIDPVFALIEGAKKVGADRIEFYTGPYAAQYHQNRERAIAPFSKAADFANEIGLGINAGHDLNLDNLAYFNENMNGLQEVSIGHALLTDALYFGISNTIQMYLQQLKTS